MWRSAASVSSPAPRARARAISSSNDLQHVLRGERRDRGAGGAVRRELGRGVADDRARVGVSAELLQRSMDPDGLEVEQLDALDPPDSRVHVARKTEVDDEDAAPRREGVGVDDGVRGAGDDDVRGGRGIREKRCFGDQAMFRGERRGSP